MPCQAFLSCPFSKNPCQPGFGESPPTKMDGRRVGRIVVKLTVPSLHIAQTCPVVRSVHREDLNHLDPACLERTLPLAPQARDENPEHSVFRSIRLNACRQCQSPSAPSRNIVWYMSSGTVGARCA